MALKFLNKKGWHTGSLRNIETVWKAEQKHEGEQKKLEELRKQIQDEREKSEFRLMQEQAGLVPKQERLEFLYDSGLQVGKVAQADEYLLGKPVEEAVQPEHDVGQVAGKPGALFVEEKPASANDSWRKLHSDPLFLIKQQEQAALARITSNPVKMAQIRKAAETEKKLKEEKKKKRKEAKRERREQKKRKKHQAVASSSEDSSDSDDPGKNRRHRHDSGGDSDAGRKNKSVQIRSRNRSRSSASRSPVPRDRRQSPIKLRDEEGELGKKKRRPSTSVSRSPVRRDPDRSGSRRADSGSRGRQWEQSGDGRLKELEGRDSENRKRAPSRSPPRSASRSPGRRNHDRSLSRKGDVMGSMREYGASGRIRKEPEDRDYGTRKRIPPRSPSRSRSRSPVRRSPVRRDHDRRSKGPDDRDSQKRTRVPSRSPLRSASRSPVRRDIGRSRSRREAVNPRNSVNLSEVRQREQNVGDERHRGPEGGGYEKRKRALSRSPSRSPCRSPGRRDYGNRRARRGDLDSGGEARHREQTNAGSADVLRSPERPKNPPEGTDAPPSRPGNKGRPPKPGQLSDAERAARLAEMQANADVHEEQRWQRLKRAADADAMEAKRSQKDKPNDQFIADTQNSMFGSQRGAASTIEKSVRRRAHFIERSSGADERNAFRR